MEILVTGGAGFIGSHIVDRLISEGHFVSVVDNLSTGKRTYLNQKAAFYNVDIRDTDVISKLFRRIQPEILYHHAAQLDVRKSVADPKFDAEVNIIGLLNLLEVGRKNGLKKVIFASSGGVIYGDAQIVPTPEEYQPLKPISPYGVAKLASENYLYYYYKAYQLPYIALRYANVYGPRQDPNGEAGVVAIFTQKLLNQEKVIINGDGKQTRDYVYIKDVVETNILSLKCEYTGPINIGTGLETDVNTIFRLLANSLNSQIKEDHGPSKIGEQQRSVLDNRLARKVLGWIPKYQLTDGLIETVAYFKHLHE